MVEGPLLHQSIKLSKRSHPLRDEEMQKYFVIKYGPQGSGKGFLEPHACKLLGIKNYVDVNVDQYVVILHERRHSSKRKTPVHLSQSQYWSLRRTADKLSDKVFQHAMKNRDHIMWETMGASENASDWIVKDYIIPAQKIGYKVVIYLPLVETSELIRRCTTRLQASKCDNMSDVKARSLNHFSAIAAACDRVFIYDNNSSSPKVLFDSMSSKPCLSISVQDKDAKDVIDYMNAVCSKGMNEGTSS